MVLMYSIFFLVTILISVAFFTLFERKILGYVHFRLGPNKNLLLGLGQPFNDLVKLFSKLDPSLSMTNLFFFVISPLIMVLFSFILWIIISHIGNSNNLKYFFLALMVTNGLLTFFFLFPGWSSGSMYSSLGGYRSSAQCISYEALFFFCIMCMVMTLFSFNMTTSLSMSYMMNPFLVFMPLIFLWTLSITAESNRTPFDFAEGESELVSGFNTEYGGGLFSIIFLSEYMSMLFYSFLTSYIMFGFSTVSLVGFFFFLALYVWVRTAYPRLRYDKLMSLSWKSFMFLVTSLMFFYLILMFF